MKKVTLSLLAMAILIGIAAIGWKMPDLEKRQSIAAKINKDFKSYWSDGKAEITSYSLVQSRYGELHEGEATMIFVTEPFSKSQQVKLDDYRNTKDRVEVLKLNALRKFDTGIYPYSTMTSVFNAYETDAKALKVSTSVQEWCGHAFMQFNRQGNKVKYSGRSYFQQEGDIDTSIPDAYMEDELWSIIRISPDLLPKGKFKLIPASLFLRLKHHDPQVINATAQLSKTTNPQFDEGELYEYTVTYAQPESRKLSIFFDTTFPYQIKGWQEEGTPIRLGGSDKRNPLVTTAILKKSIRLDYWSKNSNVHRELQLLLD